MCLWSCSYQWFFMGAAIPEEDGGCEPELRLIGVGDADVGIYVCRVSNDAGSVMSKDIALELHEEQKVRLTPCRRTLTAVAHV